MARLRHRRPLCRHPLLRLPKPPVRRTRSNKHAGAKVASLLSTHRSITTPPRMERTLRNRLFFGSLMLIGLFGLLWLDDVIDRSTRHWMEAHFGVKYGIGGAGLMIVLLLMLPAATVELAYLFTAEHVRPYRSLSSIGSGALALHAFLTQ